MAITRTTLGKLARRVANDGSEPFVVSEWDYTGDVGTDPVKVGGVSGELQIEASVGGSYVWEGAAFNVLSSRGKQMVQARISRGTADSQFIGVGVHGRDNGGSGWEFLYHAKRVGGDDEFRTGELDEPDSRNVLTQTTAGAVALGAATKINMTVFADGTDVEGYNHLDGVSHTMDSGDGITLTSGQAVLALSQGTGTRVMNCSEFYVHKDNIITMNGLPTGWKMKLLDSGESIIQTATEVGGTATINGRNLWLADVVHVITTNASDVEQERITPSEGVWGGDVFSSDAGATATPPEYLAKLDWRS